MLVLTWNLFHGRSVPDAPREQLADFAARLAGWEWDVALLQEVPPWWPPELGRACRAERAHRADLAQLAAPPLPLGRAAPPRSHQVVGRRRQRDPRARRAQWASTACARCAPGPSGAWCTACASSAVGGSATCTARRTPRRARRPTSTLAAQTATEWSAGAPVVLGRRPQHARIRSSPASTHAAEPQRRPRPRATAARGRRRGVRWIAARSRTTSRCWRRLPRKDRPEEAS